MKTNLLPAALLTLFFSVFAHLVSAQTGISYSVAASDPNPTAQGWTPIQVILNEDGDLDGDGLIDTDHTVGLISDEAGLSWQIHDHLTAAGINRPSYLAAISNSELEDFYHQGWEFEFEVRAKLFTEPFSGFCGWSFAGANDPGWNVSTGNSRVGLEFGFDETDGFWVSQQDETRIYLGAGTENDFHTIKAVGSPRSTSFALFVDEIEVGTFSINPVVGTTPSQEVLFLAGNSSHVGSTSDWKSVSLRSLCDFQFDAEVGDPDPLTQGWISSEAIEGIDGDEDGLIDDGATVGPIVDATGTSWQLHDQESAESQNLPNYAKEISATCLQEFYQDGWEYRVTVRAKKFSQTWAGFTGWVFLPANNPGWATANSPMRVGFAVGYDSGDDFWIRLDQQDKIYLGAGTSGDFHEVVLVGEPQSTDFEVFIDDVSYGSFPMAAVTGSSQTAFFSAGSSSAINNAADWKRVSLRSLIESEMVIDSDSGVLSVDGVDQEGVYMAGTDRESEYTSVAYNGLRRLVFAKDFVLLDGERLKGQGSNAISITVAGDLVIETGAVVDVSASEIEPGPGGGYGGGVAGNIGKGGNRGTGGNTVGAGGAGGAGGEGRGSFGSGTGGTGTRGHVSSTSNALISAGNSGQSGFDGIDGGAGYGQALSGGIAGESPEGGEGGESGVNATGGGGGGDGGTPNGADAGSNGSSAGKRWVSQFGYYREDGKAGGKGGDGMGATNSVSHFSLVAGGGGASGAGGSGGGGGGAGGGGRGGGGGGGGGAGVHPLFPFPLPFGGFDGGKGGNAGKGGQGGHGGGGGKGGRGGHGGGGIEFVAYGIMQIGGAFESEGSLGLSGQPGNSPTNTGRIEKTNGSDGVDGETDVYTSPGGDGGKGGNGSVGGSGQAGGAGGDGGGGAGGMIKFYGSVLVGQEASVELAGGEGAGLSNHGASGRLVIGTNTGDYVGSVSGGTLDDGYEGLKGRNEHLADLAETPLIPHLVNGADVAGLLDNTNAWTLAAIDGTTPDNARVAVMRFETGPMGYEHDFEGYDCLVFVNLTGESLATPFVGAGSYAAQLIDGGLATNPVFGGSGSGLRDVIPPYAAYATLVPEATSEVTFGYSPSTYAQSQTSSLLDGEIVYLSFGDPVTRTSEAAIDYPDPDFVLPQGGPSLEFSGTGEIAVTIEPVEAAVDAGWSVQGQPGLYQSGDTALEIPLQSQTVDFQQIPGWIPPRTQVVQPLPDTVVSVTGTYQEAPRLQLLIEVEGVGVSSMVSGIAPRTVESGDTSGFYIVDSNGVIDTSVTMSAPLVPVGGVAPTGLISLENGWFIYQPSATDRQPFGIEFTGAGMTEPVVVEFNPVPELLPEETVLQTRIGEGVGLPTAADSEFSTRLEADPVPQPNDENGNATPDKTRVVYTGKEVILSENAPNSIFSDLQFADPLNAHYAVHLYAERVEVGSEIDLFGADLIVFARELVFVGEGSFVNAGEVTLHLSALTSHPSTTERIAGYSSLTSPVDADELRAIVEPNGAPIIQEVAAPGELPVGLRWMHPLALRQMMIYLEKVYYFGFYDEAREMLRDYLALVTTLESYGYDEVAGELVSNGVVTNLPDAEDKAIAASGVLPADDGVDDFALFAFSQIAMELENLSARLSDNLDYFGNPLGWTPMLSFEVALASLEQEIDRSMNALYLSYWVGRKAEGLAADADALQNAREGLNQENVDLRGEFDVIQTEQLPAVQAQADSLDAQMDQLQADLALAEENLEQRAEELVDQRNNIPVWKKVLRGVGSVASAVPVFQPALGAVGGGLEIISRVDEQDPLDTALDVVNLGVEFGSARYDLKAQDIEDSIAEQNLSDDELQAAEYRDKASKIRSAGSGLASGVGAFQDYLKQNEAAAGEVGRELERLRATDPQLAGLSQRLQQANIDKVRFANEAARLENRMAEIPAITQQNLLGMRSLKQAQRNNSNVLNPQALGYVKGMEARAKMRLRKALYLLAKAYEYRFLEPYSDATGQPIDLVDLSDRLIAIGEAAGLPETGGIPLGADFEPLPPSELNADNFDSLRGLYDDHLAQLTTHILDGPLNEASDDESIVLTAEQLAALNGENGGVLLNLVEQNFLRKDYEQFRIVRIEVDEIRYRFTGTDPASSGSQAEVSLAILHGTSSEREQPELVRMQKNGETYLFNPLREATGATGFRRWASDAEFSDASLTAGNEYLLENADFGLDSPSAATGSLLAALTDTGADLLQFSRPAAHANLWLTKALNGVPEGTEIVFEKVELRAYYDYFVKDNTRAEIEVAPLDGSLVDALGSLEDHQAPPISPRIWVDRTDLNLRDDGYGRFVRSYSDQNAGPAFDVSLSAEHEFGQWQFVEWRRIASSSGQWETYTASGWQPSFNLDPDPQTCAASAIHPCTALVANVDHERVYPVYVYTGDTVPAEVSEIVRDDSASQGGTSEFVVSFSEDVIGVDEEDFLAMAGGSPLNILAVTGSGQTRRVRVAGQATSLKLEDNDTILDVGGNFLNGEGKGNGDLEVLVEVSGPFFVEFLGFEPSGAPLLKVTGEADAEVSLQWSDNLESESWTDVETLTLSGGEETTSDVGAIGETKRFYRVVE